MTARVWSLGQLNRVHPLPDDGGWEWIAASGDGRVVCVLMDGRIRFGNMDDVPDSVALAVILVSQGLDSLAWMADELALGAARAKERARTHRLNRQTAMAYSNDGQQTGFTAAAEMLRRGTVQP